MPDVALLLACAAFAYAVGVALVAGPLALVGAGLAGGAATVLVLALPAASVLLVEGATRLWRHTPGALGLGGFTLLAPMTIAGAAAAAAARGLQALAPPFDARAPREGNALDPWLAGALLATLVALALWRYWPAPRPRLF